jgi:spore germination protein
LPESLDAKIELLKPKVEKNEDIILRFFYIKKVGIKGAVIYLDGVNDPQALHQHVLRPLIIDDGQQEPPAESQVKSIDYLAEHCLSASKIQKTDRLMPLISSIFDGLLVVIADGFTEALIIDIHGGQTRANEEPPAEKAYRGPRDGFIEVLDLNIPLIRRRIKDPNLVVEKITIGRRTRNKVAILYIEDIADRNIVDEVRKRISSIDIDGVLAVSYIEQLVEQSRYSPFPQARPTERPDRVAADLLEGRVAVLLDGTPVVLTLPSLFVEFFQAPEDYYERPVSASVIRFLRYVAFFLAISLPAIYISLLSYHIELIPFELVVSLAQSRKAVPFSVVTEVVIMSIIIQLIIEAGLRLPGPVGQTIGVVSGIVLGQAAISSNLASPGMVIVISVTTIATFTLSSPSLVLTVRVLQFPMVLLATTLGIFGTSVGWFLILFHLISLESVGIPYLSPIAPTRYQDLKDTFIRTFMQNMITRPVSIPGKNKVRYRPSGGES